MKNINFFLVLWVIFSRLDPDPDSQSGSECGSRDPVESVFTTLKDAVTYRGGRGRGGLLRNPVSTWAPLNFLKRTSRRQEFQRITAQQTQVHLMLSWGSVHGSYCSNTELGGLTCGLLYVPIMFMHTFTELLKYMLYTVDERKWTVGYSDFHSLMGFTNK